MFMKWKNSKKIMNKIWTGKEDVFGKYSFKPKIKYFEIRTISEKMNPTKKIFGR